jgi:cytoskeletal protein RodZ
MSAGFSDGSRKRCTAMTTLPPDSSGDGLTSHTRPHESDGASLGALLRRARTDRGLTLEQISNETRIPRRHLEALEHDNFAVVPPGFYRRAEIRAYARAVNLDQNLALTELERPEGVPETPGVQESAPSHKRVLIVIGVVVAAAVFGRAIAEREPARHGDAQGRSAADSPQSSVPPAREMPRDPAVETLQRTTLDQAARPSARPDNAPAVAMEPTGTRGSTASNGDAAVATAHAEEARVSAGSVTALVVTTQPPGARVTVNGIGWGIAPVTIRHLPAGDKRIRVSKEGYSTEERMVHLAEGRMKTLDIRLDSAP